MAAAALWLRPRTTNNGVYSSPVIAAADRQSVEMAGRAVAVLEPAARLSWSNSGKAIVVKQTAGSVFYRVNSGNPFVVKTPEGDVVVHGTCFRIEVLPMNNTVKLAISAGIGAAVASAVLVTVYEGNVAVEHAGKTEIVAAGEQMRIGGNAAKMALGPRPIPTSSNAMTPELVAALAPPRAGATVAELLHRDELLRGYAVSLDQKVAALEKEVKDKPWGPPAAGGKQPWDFSPADWRELSKQCGLYLDVPELTIPVHQIEANKAEQLGLSLDEVKLVNAALKRNVEPLIAEIRALYVEVTGDEQGADALDPQSMERELEQKAGPEAAEARKRIALEKAGDLTPPADSKNRPPIERYYRRIAYVADHIEADLAAIIGAERAREFRANSALFKMIMGCPDEGDQ
ncbi:MAG: FecR domain-containing protein [Myxococcales bacterium]|nr:FecR domain-containing protein [Myxococcales bacterium]